MKNEQRERGAANDRERKNNTTRTNSEEKDKGQRRAKEVALARTARINKEKEHDDW